MKRIVLRFRDAYRNAVGENKGVTDHARERRYESDPRTQVLQTGEEHASAGDERTYERAFADRGSLPVVQYC